MLAVTHFIFPEGALRDDMLPGHDLAEAVGVWLSAAEDRTDDEDGQEAWVYHRAYQAIYERLSSLPSSYSVGEKGSVSYSAEQIKTFRRLAAEYRATYDKITREPEESFAVVRSLR